jgi:hypothetical protein
MATLSVLVKFRSIFPLGRSCTLRHVWGCLFRRLPELLRRRKSLTARKSPQIRVHYLLESSGMALVGRPLHWPPFLSPTVTVEERPTNFYKNQSFSMMDFLIRVKSNAYPNIRDYCKSLRLVLYWSQRPHPLR